MARNAFDNALLYLTSQNSRRTLLGGVLGLLAAGTTDSPSEAKKRKKKKCKGGTTKCGKKCVNLKTDSANCGACGTACPAGQVCANGVCGCPAGQSLVQGVCIPTFGCTAQTDSCGATQTNCPLKPDLNNAFCLVTPEGQTFCGDVVDCVATVAECTPVAGKPRLLLACTRCDDVTDIGVCALPVSA